MDVQKFGGFLQAQRKRLGLTQAELAERIHVTDKAVSRWERGVGLPDIQLLEPLSQALGLSLTELIRCERIEADTVSRDAADAAVADTLALVRAKRQRTLLYWLIAFPVWCVEAFLLYAIIRFVEEPWVRSLSVFLIITGGSLVMHTVKELLNYRFGLVKTSSRKPWLSYVMILLAFLSGIVLALYIPIHMTWGRKAANIAALISIIVWAVSFVCELWLHVRSMPTGME